MFELEGVSDRDFFANLVVHGVNVSLVDGHAALGEGRCVVDRDVVQLWVIRPILICQNMRMKIDKTIIHVDAIDYVYPSAKQV